MSLYLIKSHRNIYRALFIWTGENYSNYILFLQTNENFTKIVFWIVGRSLLILMESIWLNNFNQTIFLKICFTRVSAIIYTVPWHILFCLFIKLWKWNFDLEIFIFLIYQNSRFNENFEILSQFMEVDIKSIVYLGLEIKMQNMANQITNFLKHILWVEKK